MPLVTVTVPAPPPAPSSSDDHRSKSWLTYLPLLFAILLVLLPQPSYTLVLTSYYLTARHAPLRFAIHLVAVHVFTLLALTSLMICVVRNPGSVGERRKAPANKTITAHHDADNSVTTSLLSENDPHHAHDWDMDSDTFYIGRWCARCRVTRPERAHHCTTCNRCILKMDHHCPWLGGNCIGHRTYPAFIHFLLMTSLLAGYVTFVSLSVTIDLIKDPFVISPRVSPLHGLFLLLVGAIFTLTMASFLAYHMYLISTNQTTLEHMSPFFLLRYIPPPTTAPPAHTDTLSAPPYTTTAAHPPAHEPPSNAYAEHTLTAAQRRLVQRAHERVRPYDLGLRRNWGAVFGGGCPDVETSEGGRRIRAWARWIAVLMLCGGGRPKGDGWTFERGSHVEEKLSKLGMMLEREREAA